MVNQYQSQETMKWGMRKNIPIYQEENPIESNLDKGVSQMIIGPGKLDSL